MAGDSPNPAPKSTRPQPIQPNPTQQTSDPVSPHLDPQVGGSLAAPWRPEEEIQKEVTKEPLGRSPATTHVQRSGGVAGGPAQQQEGVQATDQQTSEELAQDILAILHNGSTQAAAAQEQGAVQKTVVIKERADASKGGPFSASGFNASQRPAEGTEILKHKSGINQSSKPDLASSSGTKQCLKHSSSNPAAEARIPSIQKEKWVPSQEDAAAARSSRTSGVKVKSPSTAQWFREMEEGGISGEPSWHEEEHHGDWKEVKRPFWWRRERQSSTPTAGRRQQTELLPGTAKFKKLAAGKCFNCFGHDHHVKDCSSLTTCWRCGKQGHRSYSCPSTKPTGYLSHKQRAKQEHQAVHHTSSTKHHFTFPPNALGRSYLEVARGTPAVDAMTLPEYPRDPNARPAAESVFISATGDIRRRRDALLGKAPVCWLAGDNHDSRPSHLGDALRARMDMGWNDFQVLKHFPEQYLVIFRDEQLRQRVTRQQRLEDGGRVFHFATWNEARGAADAHLEFRVNVRLEGIPAHAWGEDVAALILGRSCAIHYVEEHTRRRERTRTFDLWAWCADPCRIPRRVWLTITDPDAEPPSVDIPRNRVQVHHEEPSGLKHGLGYEVFPHVEVVEDLSFINGDGGQGGPPNRKRRRVFQWKYGQPDSLGEARGNRNDRGREEHRHYRRDDRDDDRGGHHRRHRSASVWGRAVRCRTGAADCYSSTVRGRGFTGSHRSRAMQWIPNISNKIASAAARVVARCDTGEAVAIKEAYLQDGVEMTGGITTSSIMEAAREINVQDMVQALPTANMCMFHLDNPLNKPEMEAIQELLEHGNKLGKKPGRAVGSAKKASRA